MPLLIVLRQYINITGGGIEALLDANEFVILVAQFNFQNLSVLLIHYLHFLGLGASY